MDSKWKSYFKIQFLQRNENITSKDDYQNLVSTNLMNAYIEYI